MQDPNTDIARTELRIVDGVAYWYIQTLDKDIYRVQLETTGTKRWEELEGRSASQADQTPADEGATPTAEAIENQREAKIQHGMAKTPDGEQWQRDHPAGLTEQQIRQAEKERRRAEKNKG